MQNNKNFLIFLVLSLLIMMTWMYVEQQIWPRKKPEPKPVEAQTAPADPNALVAGLAGSTQGDTLAPGSGIGGMLSVVSNAAVARQERPALFRVVKKTEPAQPPVVEKPKRPPGPPVTLGDDEKFFLRVVLTPKGAGVRSVVLNDFQLADEMGKPVWRTDEDGKRVPAPMELVRGDDNIDVASNLLYHYPRPDEIVDPRPLPLLGTEEWEQVGPVERTPEEHRVSFRTTASGVTITKTYTLHPGDYHVGLEVTMQADKETPFRYQLTSAHGVRLEGEWYTSVLRNAVVGRVDDKTDTAYRSLQDLRYISHRAGGDKVSREPSKQLRYGGVSVQYFTSLVVVDNEQENKGFLDWARPTVESGVIRQGHIKSVADDRKSFVITGPDHVDYRIHLPTNAAVAVIGPEVAPGLPADVVFLNDPNDIKIAERIYTGDYSGQLLFDDITVRLVSEKLDLKPGEPVTHKYLLYNGPVKVRLLGLLDGKKKVDPELIDRYENKLHLNTLTDYPSPGWFGEYVTGPTGLSWLIIQFTNVLHYVLAGLHWLIPSWLIPSWMGSNYGLCIILLTILVRGLMFPVSRKQALMSVKMQAMGPEMQKLKEKYKDDPQGMQVATMELYRKHGINPLGTCWLIFLQMPIFVALYCALQESIQFRLAPFLWIQNLAAPDMLFYWGQQIPWISAPSSYGGMLYLGPFFNLLPVLSVGLFLMQQKMMTPPAKTPEEEQQQTMMKFMTVFMGILFYKMAAGLCIYFIASSLWGLAERQLLPKKKPAAEPEPEPAEPKKDGLVQRAQSVFGLGGSKPAEPKSEAIQTTAPVPQRNPKKKRKKGKGGQRKEETEVRPAQAKDEGGILNRVQRWWADLLRSAEKR